ncbi:MAG: hypothetical protein IPK16_33560 [Anaerolineales bacterium]|nr:hypothetical protein [Anaerolineales bacterium]
MREGAIAAVLHAIDADHEVIIVNYSVWNQDFTRELHSELFKFDTDRAYPSGDDVHFFSDVATGLTFIGSVVLHRSLWLSRRRPPYYGTEFIHVGVLFQARLPGSALVLAKPFVGIRYGNASWTGRTFAIWMFKWPMLIWSFTAYPESARAAVSARTVAQSAHPVLLSCDRRLLTHQNTIATYITARHPACGSCSPAQLRAFRARLPIPRGWAT